MKRKMEVLTEAQQELEDEVQKQVKESYANKDKKVRSTANLRKLLPYYAKYKWSFVLLILMMIVSLGVSFLEPILSAKVIECLTIANFDDAMRYLLYNLGAGLCLCGIKYIISQLDIGITNKMRLDLKQEMMKNINRTSMQKLDNLNSGILNTRINNDSNQCSYVIADICDYSMSLIKSLAFFIYIAFINIWLFLVLLVCLIISYIVTKIRTNVYLKNSKIARKRMENGSSIYYEQIKGVRDVKALNMSDNMLKVSEDKYGYVLKKDMEVLTKNYIIFYGLQAPFSYVIDILFCGVGALLIKSQAVTFASFMMVWLYKSRVMSVTSNLTGLMNSLTEGELAAERYFEVIEKYEKDEFGTVDKIVDTGKIEFKNVEFGYDEDSKVLKGLNLVIEPNKTTAIVGGSGAGKTTMLSLIGKMYVPTDGKILVDDINLNDLTESSLRNAIGIVNQNPYMFNATIRNNMKYVKMDATEEEIWSALDSAQIGDFVRGLDNGLDSMIGENGVKVSGGQKQRLAIARVLLKGSRVLVFDEATSSLDNISQSAIVDELDKLKSDHTIIVVAHRLSTIVNADTIVVLENGKVEAQGSHKELLKSCESYKNLYKQEKEMDKMTESN